MTGHVPPHDERAEIALIGSVLLEGGISKLSEPVDVAPRDFYLRRHALLWEALAHLEAQGLPADLVTIHEELSRRGQLDEAGGLTYLAGIQGEVPSSAYAAHYARIVQEKSTLRQLIHAAHRLAGACYEAEKPLEELLSQAAQLSAVGGMNTGAGVRSIAESADELLDEILNGTRERGLDTGLRDLNEKLNGLEPGRLYILAARPSMGKSALAMQMGLTAARQGHRVLGFSLEMPDSEITARLLSQESRVGLEAITESRTAGGKRLDARAAERVVAAHRAIRQLPFYFSDRSNLSLDEMMREIRREHARAPLGLVIIDYLQLLSVPDSESNLTAKTTRISQSLKRLARDLNIPVLCLSQLNRDVEKRVNRRPLPSDLRDSGSIEQDADVIIFIYRDEKYDENSADAGTAELIVAKQRSGPTGMVRVAFNGHFVKFQDLAYA